jgi:GT2 family glycosyltransferase
MSQTPEISVIVVNYNGRFHLDTCLRALSEQEGVPFEIILVDNASVDGSVEFVRDTFPSVRLLVLGANEGFAGGNNRGAGAARGRLLAFLNNDTRVEPGWLVALRNGLGWSPDVAMVTSRIVFMRDPTLLDSAGDGVTRAGGAFKRGHGGSATRHLRRREVFGACGAAFLIRRDVFEEVRGFDEDFFLSHEDVDLSYRVRLRGYRCVYMPEAVVRHAGSATLGRVSALSVFYGQRNLEWMYFKNTPGWALPATLPLHALYFVAALGYFTYAGRLGSFLSAKWAALQGMPRIWRKRREVQQTRRASTREIWSLLEPGWIGLKLREKRFELGVARPR